jgi:gamma-glutamylcyclotransferase (GGCT)/AIG2-like uncharacterized protein YtfP
MRVQRSDSLLFVYGSLRPACGNPMSRYLEARATLLGRGRIRGTLYDLGWYAALVCVGAGEVQGELYRITEPGIWRTLDRYEGCSGAFARHTEYVRVLRPIRTAGQILQSWVYVYNQPLPSTARQILCGDYLPYYYG